MGITQSTYKASGSLKKRLNNIVKLWNHDKNSYCYTWDRCIHCNHLVRIEIERDESNIQGKPILSSGCDGCHSYSKYSQNS